MFSWIVLTGLLLGFMIGTYYLYYYWYSNYRKLEHILTKDIYKKVEMVPKIDKKSYEFAYQNNTSFNSKEELINESARVHQVYAFHSDETPP